MKVVLSTRCTDRAIIGNSSNSFETGLCAPIGLILHALDLDGTYSMRHIIILYIFLAIVAFAVIGSLYIFDVRTGEEALELLLKTEGALLLLGGCSFAVSLLVCNAGGKSQE